MISGGGGSIFTPSQAIVQGTAAALPGTPATPFYFATDTGELYTANAGLTAWQSIAKTSATAVLIGTSGTLGAAGTVGTMHFTNNFANFGQTVDLTTVGAGLRVAEGANAKQGTGTLAAGTVVVANTNVTANSRILLTAQTVGGTAGALAVTARTAGTSFTVTSSSGTDTSTFAYEIFEPG